jgi:hypothetical protein
MLRQIQRALEVIYGLPAGQTVEEFVVSRAGLALMGAQERASEEL